MPPAPAAQTRPLPGDPAPLFSQRSLTTPSYAFGSAAGRYLVLCFHASSRDPHAAAALAAARDRRDLFDDRFASFFGVTNDPLDEAEDRIANRVPGIRHFLDFDFRVSRAYGIVPPEDSAGPTTVTRAWVVIDPGLRVIRAIPFRKNHSDIAEVMDLLDSLPVPDLHKGIELSAPILYLPQVFEPELCARLIGLYEAQGGTESGYMKEVNGRTVGVTDHSFKSRKDYDVRDATLIAQLQARIRRRIVPEIHKVHQFTVSRMERNIVSCYAAEDGGHFSAHRDNTTRGTAHRRFAVSINLNDDFDGGEVSFPEYGTRGYKAPPGGAVVFSCSMLHRVSRVTRGRRYAFLPFLYDEAAAQIRDANRHLIGAEPAEPAEPSAGPADREPAGSA